MRRYLITSLLVLLPAAMVYFCSHPVLVGILEDEIIYQEMSESFDVRGNFSVETLPGQPSITKYPPLYPMILSLVIKPAFSFHQWAADRAYILLQIILTAFLAYWLLILWGKRLGLTLAEQIAVMGAIFFNYHVLMVFAAPMSEALFMLAGVILTYYSYPGGVWDKKKGGVVCLSAGVLILTRSIGVSVVAGLVAFFCKSRKYKMMAALILTLILTIGIVKLYQSHYSEFNQDRAGDDILSYYTSYDYHSQPYWISYRNGGIAGLMQAVGTNVTCNVKNGLESLSELLFPFYEESIQSSGHKTFMTIVLGFFIAILFVMGLIFMKEYWYLLYVTLPYILMLLVWTWPFTGRFWVPILPLLLLGLRGLLLRLGRMGTWFFLALCASTIMMNVPFVVGRMAVALSSPDAIDQAESDEPMEVREYKQHLQWIKKQSLENKEMILLGGLNTMQKARQYGIYGAWLEPLNGPDPFLRISVGSKLTPLEMEKEQSHLADTLERISHDFPGKPIFIIADFTMNKRYRHYLDLLKLENNLLTTDFVSEGGNIKIYKINFLPAEK